MCKEDKAETPTEELSCDYLVVGAGTAGMSFIDTLLTEDPAATVILVDRNSKPGGHWTMAYPFVRLHQPSCNYGVNSLRLGKTSDAKGREAFDIDDRATGAEVVEYYEKVAEQFKGSGRVRCFFDVEYEAKDDKHGFVDKEGLVCHVKCRKVVTVGSKVVVPSMRGPLIPVHESVSFSPVNHIPEAVESGKYTSFIVVGAGKTGSDAVLELLARGIDQSAISWIISRDVWYILRDGLYSDPNYWQCGRKMLEPMIEASSAEGAFLALEKQNIFGRLQPNGKVPLICKGPTIEIAELAKLRSIKNVLRLGRVKSIAEDKILLENGMLPLDATNTLVVDCMVDQLYGYLDFDENFRFFEHDRINLGPTLAVFNPSFSSAIVAYIEATFKADEPKNKLCFPLVGKYSDEATIDLLLGGLYAQSKQLQTLMTHPPARKFILNSRTNLDAPMHHGGVWKMLWAMLGPPQLAKSFVRLVEKIENGGYTGIDHTFGIDRNREIRSKEIRAWLRESSEGSVKRETHIPYPQKHSMGSAWSCCTSADAVVKMNSSNGSERM